MVFGGKLLVSHIPRSNFIPELCQEFGDFRFEHDAQIFSESFLTFNLAAAFKYGEGRFRAVRCLAYAAAEAQRRDLMRRTGRGTAGNMDFRQDAVREVFFTHSLNTGMQQALRISCADLADGGADAGDRRLKCVVCAVCCK